MAVLARPDPATMNAPLPASVLSVVELAPRDPILGVTDAFVADANPNKVNLGVGVYNDDSGKLPVLDCVRRAEQAIADKSAPRGYLPIDGLQTYDLAAQKLLFGADSEIVAELNELASYLTGPDPDFKRVSIITQRLWRAVKPFSW